MSIKIQKNTNYRLGIMMKPLSIIFSIAIFFQLNLFAQFPNSPDKICFDYDGAGNRIAQKPAWINILSPIDCQCNDPDEVVKKGKLWYIEISDIKYVDLNIDIVKRYVGVSSSIGFSIMDYRDVIETQTISTIDQVLSHPISNIEGIIFVLNQSSSRELVLRSSQVTKDETINSTFELRIAPNPNEGQFNVIQNGFKVNNSTITILDANGKLLFSRAFLDGEVNVSEYPSGVYILTLNDNERSRSIRFVKK